MITTKTITTVLLGTALLTLQACSSNTATEASADNAAMQISATTKGQYAKPGAAVDFSHNYDGHTEVGETETFQVRINERYETGMLNVGIDTGEGLALKSSATQANFSMEHATDKVIDISVSSETAGLYYVNLFAQADAGNGQVMPRAYAVAIYVGDKNKYIKRDTQLKIEDTKGGKIIVMDAEETIQ